VRARCTEAHSRFVPFPSRVAHDRSLVEHVQRLMRSGCLVGDISILTPSNYAASELRSALKRVGIPSIDLLDYRGKTEHVVKVGTIKRARGL
jgi:hypothetical protein